MPLYRLTRAAEDDLTELYAYSFQEYGEAQADAYFESLESSLNRLSENPQLGVTVESLRPGYRRFTHQRHSIYYQISKSGIIVVRVLGPGMSPERNL